MSGKQGPTLRAQWLGQQLRDLREAAGLKLSDAADYLQRNQATISRFESAEYPIRRPDVMALLDLYGVSQKRRRAAMMTLAEEVWQTGWWDGYAEDVDRRFVDYVWLESRAREVWSFDDTLLLGLLQTRDYAATVMRAADPTLRDDQIARGLELRMMRQEVLSAASPPRLLAILDEALLHRMVGGPDVMQKQLEHLLHCTREAHIELRVLPFTVGAHVSPAGAFRVLRLREPYPDVGYVETPAGGIYVESAKAEQFTRMYDRLCEVALSPDESSELIAAAAKDLR